MTIQENIKRLKEEKNAIILAHIYQEGEVQDVADFVGDSLELSRKALNVECDTIVFCGVRFMAESAKILNPNKTVLLPAFTAGCPMADMLDADDIKAYRSSHPDAAVVCYVNSSAEAKAESDICCTSSNAVKIVKSLDEKKIIFVPDENLGSYVAAQVPEKEVILHKGYCIVHHRLLLAEIEEALAAQPDAQLLVHPECREEVVNRAHFVGSTAQIIKYAKESDNKKFIVATEMGILHILKNQNPDKIFYIASPKLLCVNMKKTTLKEVENSLENMEHEVLLDPELMKKARKSLDRMLEII